MIFVTTGTTESPFERLVEASETLTDFEDVVVQYGSAARAPLVHHAFKMAPPAEVERFFQTARVVVCHAGVGSISASLAAGKRPIVVPRRQDLGENVDDHQHELGVRLAALGLATLVEDVGELGRAVRESYPTLSHTVGLSPRLVESLRLELVRCR
jgi:UDP-N-acetylglucosamine transferase subunit ALG13